MIIALEDWTDDITIGGFKISNLHYADETNLSSTNVNHMEEVLQRMERDFNLLLLSDRQGIRIFWSVDHKQ